MTDAGYKLELERAASTCRVRIAGRIDLGNAHRLLQELLQGIPREASKVALDLASVDYFDSGGGAVLIGLRQELAERGATVEIAASTTAIDGFLQLLPDAEPAPNEGRKVPEQTTLVERLGGEALYLLSQARELVVFTGDVILGLRDAALDPSRLRWRETWHYMQRAGVDGLPIVALISFLMGVITAFQAAIQLTQFGADIYIANLVGLSIVRELGPLMTAIIAAGRSGAAFAAEIGTMKVSEEVDALETMGLDRTRFLVTPKVLALLIMLPCLTIYSDLVGILGGLTVATGWLGLPAQVYIQQLNRVLVPWDFVSGLIKSLAFALLIAGVGCLRGFQAETGAESVGRITTSAIVAAIFLIIVADAIFTVLFHYVS